MPVRTLVGFVSILSVLAGEGGIAARQQPAPTPPVRLGPGVVNPQLLKEVRPNYTPAAMRERVEGVVVLEAVIETDGTVGDVKVIRPLHPELDPQAIAAARQWLFRPATLGATGQPVACLATLELTFRIFSAPPFMFELAVKEGTPGLVPPRVKTSVQPTYTAEALKAGIQGKVLVEAVVDVDGVVRAARIKQGLDSGPAPVQVENRYLLRDSPGGLDGEALIAARQWTFEPATMSEKPVMAITTLEFTFALK